MEILIAFTASLLFIFVFRKPIKSAPVVFYVIAIVLDLVFLSQLMFSSLPLVLLPLYPYMQRCLFAFGLFAAVMFVGALPEDSRIRKYIAPIRGEVSIIAAILTGGHIANYLNSYIYQFLSGFAGMSNTMIMSFAVAAILVVLLAILTITSFNAVRRRMTRKAWKRVQWLAYPFFLLIYIHLVLILSNAAAAIGYKAFISVAIYTIMFLLYIGLRGRKWYVDKKVENALTGETCPQQ